MVVEPSHYELDGSGPESSVVDYNALTPFLPAPKFKLRALPAVLRFHPLPPGSYMVKMDFAEVFCHFTRSLQTHRLNFPWITTTIGSYALRARKVQSADGRAAKARTGGQGQGWRRGPTYHWTEVEGFVF